MTKKDGPLCAAFGLVLLIGFGRLLLGPGLILGNFGDIYAYHYPLRHLVVSSLQEGRFPLWNPYIFAGTPLSANPQAVLFYPGSALHGFFPLAWALTLDAFLHLFFAWLGAFLLLRRWRLERAGAWALSVSYAASPFLVYRLSQGIPTHLAGLSWIPWVWLAAQSGWPLLALTLGLQILSGHPQFALLNLLALGLYAAIRAPRLLPRLVFATGTAVILDLVQTAPTLQFLAHSVRTQWTSGYSLGYSLKPAYLLTFLYPGIWGDPFQAGFSLFPSEFFEMLAAYIGLIPLVLGAFGFSRNLALPAMAAAGVFFALGENNPLYVPLQRFLGLDFLRVPARFAVVALWALWLGAAVGWRGLCAACRPGVKAGLVLAASFDVLLWSLPWIYAQDPSLYLAPNPAALRAIRTPGWRVATSPDLPSANKAMLYRVPNVTGYEAFYLAPIALYTSRSEGEAAADGSRTYVRRWRSPGMARLGVRHYLSADRVEENPAAPPIVQGAVSFASPRPERWEATARGPGAVVFAQADYPGWEAWVDGKRVPRSIEAGLFSTVPLTESGLREVRFQFRSAALLLGALVSLSSLAALAFLAAGRLDRWKY